MYIHIYHVFPSHPLLLLPLVKTLYSAKHLNFDTFLFNHILIFPFTFSCLLLGRFSPLVFSFSFNTLNLFPLSSSSARNIYSPSPRRDLTRPQREGREKAAVLRWLPQLYLVMSRNEYPNGEMAFWETLFDILIYIYIHIFVFPLFCVMRVIGKDGKERKGGGKMGMKRMIYKYLYIYKLLSWLISEVYKIYIFHLLLLGCSALNSVELNRGQRGKRVLMSVSFFF